MRWPRLPHGFSSAYLHFRSSGHFVLLYTGIWSGWLILNSLLRLHFDPDNILLNLLLSIEAGYMTPMFLRASQEDRQLLQSGIDQDRATAERVRKILALVQELDENAS